MQLKFLGIFFIILLSFSISSNAFAIPTIKGPKLYADKPITGNYGNIIAVELSGPCLSLAKINSSGLCPNYLDLEKFDTTNQKISGKFFFDGLFYHRDKPQYKNYQLSYPKSKFPLVVCVDCSKQIIDYSKVIYVKSSDSFNYTSKTKNKVKDFSLVQFDSRFINPKECKTAVIKWDETLLLDTINYLNSNCKITSFNETKTIIMKPIKITYDGKEYQYQKWLEQAKKHKTENCLKSNKC